MSLSWKETETRPLLGPPLRGEEVFCFSPFAMLRRQSGVKRSAATEAGWVRSLLVGGDATKPVPSTSSGQALSGVEGTTLCYRLISCDHKRN